MVACETARSGTWQGASNGKDTCPRWVFRKLTCVAAVTNLRELLMALWNERRPDFAHQLTGRVAEGWMIASSRAPTRLHRCAVCAKWLHTGPSRLLPCWKAAVYSSKNDHEYLANYGSEDFAPLGLRQKWNITKRDAPAERVATIRSSCLPQERFGRS